MNHDIFMVLFMLATIPLFFVLMYWSKSKTGWTKQQQNEFWERRLEIRTRRLMAMLPHSIQLWRNLLLAVQDKEPEDAIKKKAKEVADYIKLMAA
jgi:hypothetical protein